jgi:hypothetical protein
MIHHLHLESITISNTLEGPRNVNIGDNSQDTIDKFYKENSLYNKENTILYGESENYGTSNYNIGFINYDEFGNIINISYVFTSNSYYSVSYHIYNNKVSTIRIFRNSE